MKITSVIACLIFIMFSSSAYADMNTVSLRIAPAPNTPSTFMVNIIDNKTGNPMTESNLKVARTKRLHFLVIDPSLTEYYHIYPTVVKDGVWSFDFAPARTHKFRVWADLTRLDTGKQEYAAADIGSYDPKYKLKTMEKTLNNSANIGEYNFTLKLDSELKSGDTTIATITVTKDGAPFTDLKPLMGAFAYAVGFYGDYNSIMHIRPMGKEPENISDKDGPVLHFHIAPSKPGFVKIYVQFNINGQDVYVPFGVMVK